MQQATLSFCCLASVYSSVRLKIITTVSLDMATELTSMLHILPTEYNPSVPFYYLERLEYHNRSTQQQNTLYTRNFIVLGPAAVSLAKSTLQES
jgi:hypothetical protein